MKKKNYENYKNLNRTMNIKMLIAFILGAIISIFSSYAIAETLIKSADVSYVDNAKLGATNVQAAIDGTCTKFSNDLSDLKTNLKKEILNEAYPINSVYISYSNTNPGTIFGGTWEIIGDGRVLKGIKSGTAGTTGGSSTVTLSTSNLPAHTHDISHTHTTKASSITDVSVSTAELKGTIVMHNVNYYTNISYVSGAFSAGNTLDGYSIPNDYIASASSVGRINLDVSHTHTVTGTVPSLTTNSISTTTSGSAGSTNPTAINVQDPYITVYMWRRTK